MASSKTAIKKLKNEDLNQKSFKLKSSIKNEMIKKLFELNNEIMSNYSNYPNYLNDSTYQKQKIILEENTELIESLKKLPMILNKEDSERSNRTKEEDS